MGKPMDTTFRHTPCRKSQFFVIQPFYRLATYPEHTAHRRLHLIVHSWGSWIQRQT